MTRNYSKSCIKLNTWKILVDHILSHLDVFNLGEGMGESIVVDGKAELLGLFVSLKISCNFLIFFSGNFARFIYISTWSTCTR
jgi:hypothetical protein